MSESKVGVIGCGQMGLGIIQTVLQAGYSCCGVELSPALADKGKSSLARHLQGAVERGKLSAEAAASALGRFQATDALEHVADCDLVIEAVPEREEIKAEVLRRLGGFCRPDAIVATNTSSLSVTRLMLHYPYPERFAGLHFFNPVPAMRLVEVVETLASDPEVMNRLLAFARSLGKTPVRCQDRTGFLVNRLLIPYLLDAVRALESGTGSKEDIDSAMKLGCGHPMGPFELMDFIGLDTICHIADILFAEFGESRMAAPPLLKRMVYAGRLGRKSGNGFYPYPN